MCIHFSSCIYFSVSERGAHWGVNSVAECSTNFFSKVYIFKELYVPQNMIDIATNRAPVSLLFSFIFCRKV